MNKVLLLLLLVTISGGMKAQKVDSIFFHLYTDSLKKGTHNYINVDGKLSNGNWMPMTVKEINFSSSSCSFAGNELIIPENFGADKITIKAVLKANPAVWIERTIWIKQLPDPDLPVPSNTKPSKRRRN